MDKNDVGNFIILILCVVFSILVTWGVVHGAWEKESVKTGHAEYILDGNRAVWQWKEK